MSRGKLLQVKRRIEATKSLKKITKAMEMVATAQIKKVEKNVQFAREILKEAKNLVDKVPIESKHPFVTGEGKKTLLVLAPDMGLCGAFPTEISKRAMLLMKKEKYNSLFVVGAKVAHLFKNEPILVRTYEHEFAVPNFDFSKIVTNDLRTNGSGSIKIVYGKFKSKLAQVPDVFEVTPVVKGSIISTENARYDFEPVSEEMLESLLNFYVASVIYALLYETKISELYARQNAMRNATENADEVIKQLTVDYNKARQASITQELIEIVSGADALKE